MKIVIAIIALTLCAVPAAAQRETETGTRFTRPKPAKIPDNTSLSEAERGRVALAGFANCLIERNPRKVDTVLNSSGSNSFTQMEMNECLRSGQMRFEDSLLRGALYSKLYRRHYAAVVPDLPERPIDFSLNLPSGADGRVAILMFADCLARNDLENARLFILSAGGSVAEKNAFAALRPFIGPCVPQGQTVTLSRSAIGSALAEVLYRQATPHAGAGVH